MEENQIEKLTLGAAIEFHRILGPRLLESVYEETLAYELQRSGLHVDRQVTIPIRYKSLTFDKGFRADLGINNKVLLELKSTERIEPAHKKQLQTYLKLTNLKLGYLLNFNVTLLKNGIVRAVNGLSEATSNICPSNKTQTSASLRLCGMH